MPATDAQRAKGFKLVVKLMQLVKYSILSSRTARNSKVEYIVYRKVRTAF